MILSIIIPIYNAERYLVDCLNSIVNMDYYNKYEVIMINDGSTDSSKLICEKYEATYSNFILVNQANMGVSCARNNAIKFAKGDYLLFIDADDKLCDNALEVIIRNIELFKLDLFIYSFIQKYEDGRTKECIVQSNNYVKMGGKEKVHALFTGGQAPWRKVYSRSIILSNNIEFPIDISHGEDGLFNCRYLEHCSSCVVLQDIIYQHYIRENTLSTSPNFKYLSDIDVVYDEELKFVRKNGNKEDLYKLDTYFLRFLMLAIKTHGNSKSFIDNLKKFNIFKSLICERKNYGKISLFRKLKIKIIKFIIKHNLFIFYRFIW